MPRPVRFVHTADLHLDAPFAGVEAADARVRDALLESTYQALDRIVEACLERAVDFLVISGDCYNARDKSLRAQIRFASAMQRLAAAGVEVFVAQGNHDPADGWSANLSLPDTVRYFPTGEVGRFEVARDGETIAVLYGRGFARAAETSNLAAGFRRGEGDAVAIGVLHANVGGNTDYEPYAPCSLDDLRAAGMDYWALGHIHKPARLIDRPRANYAGSPQGLNPKEDGPHGCLAVEISNGVVTEESVPTHSIAWAHSSLDASGLAGLGDVRGALRDECARLREQAGVPVLARIDLVGRSAAHADLARRAALRDLAADARDEQLSREPWLWLDRVRDLTAAELDIDAIRAGGDFAAQLVRLADRVLADEDALDALVGEVLDPVRKTVGDADPGMSNAEIVERARDVCLDRLLAETESR